ncbi:MAG: hypothetical protein J6X14_06370 [Lachnospiraceae bacterium]|nr:hypothetical protein [Lachnospiraceae bacterium]MBP5669919.1 hypothetical protein [Lachnospiraceae bacterium]
MTHFEATHGKRAKKNTSRAWNAQHSMIPKRSEGRDEGRAQWHVTKVTHIGAE